MNGGTGGHPGLQLSPEINEDQKNKAERDS